MSIYSHVDSNSEARRMLKFGMGFVVLLIVMAFVFFIVASRMERHLYHQNGIEHAAPAGPQSPETPATHGPLLPQIH